MSHYSAGLNLAGEIAGDEARIAHCELVNPPQLFIGTCSLSKCIDELEFTGGAEAEVRIEYEALNAVFEHFNLDVAKMRRAVRKEFGQGNFYEVKLLVIWCG